MELNTNLISLLTWGSGVRIVSWILALFVFWRANKNEIIPDKLYSQISFMFIGGMLSSLVALMLNLPSNLILPITWVVISVVCLGKANGDYWAALDNLVSALVIVMSVNWVVVLINHFSFIHLIGVIGMVLYIFVISSWIRKNYRVLSWYPSGRTGFIFLIFSIYALLLTLLIDFFANHVLYWQVLILLVLLITIWFWYKRSGRNMRNELKIFVNNLARLKFKKV